MGKNAWDVVSEVFARHGLAGIMLLAVAFMYWENKTYERANDKMIQEQIKEVSTEVAVISYKVNDIDESLDRLEDKVYISIDTNGDGLDDNEWIVVDYSPKEAL